METNEIKTAFFSQLYTELKNRELLRQEVYKTVFYNALDKFDGKVYNKRFDNYLNDELKKVSPLLSVSCDNKGANDYFNPSYYIVQIVFNCRNSSTNYTDSEKLYINMVLKNNRIQADDTKREEYTLKWLESFDEETRKKRSILEKYDDYFRIYEQMEKAVQLYNGLPTRFRRHLNRKYYALEYIYTNK